MLLSTLIPGTLLSLIKVSTSLPTTWQKRPLQLNLRPLFARATQMLLPCMRLALLILWQLSVPHLRLSTSSLLIASVHARLFACLMVTPQANMLPRVLLNLSIKQPLLFFALFCQIIRIPWSFSPSPVQKNCVLS